MQRFSNLDIPTKYAYFIGMTILISVVGSLKPIFMLIMNTMHSPI